MTIINYDYCFIAFINFGTDFFFLYIYVIYFMVFFRGIIVLLGMGLASVSVGFKLGYIFFQLSVYFFFNYVYFMI